jgi:hypothetical protein
MVASILLETMSEDQDPWSVVKFLSCELQGQLDALDGSSPNSGMF